MTTGSRRHPWPVAPAFPRALALITLLAALLCVATVATAVHRAQPRVVRSTVTLDPPPLGLGATGCSQEEDCAVVGIPEVLSEAVGAAFRHPAVLYSTALALSATGRIVSESVRLQTTAGVAVAFDALCLTGGGAVPARDPEGFPTVGPASLVIVVPGATGCSVAVSLLVPPGASVPLTQALDLARDASVQLAP